MDLLVLCAEAVTEPQGINLIMWACAMGEGPPHAELARILHHPSFDWYARKHASYISYISQHDGWYEELR